MKIQNSSFLFTLMAGFLLIAVMNACAPQPGGNTVSDIDGNVYKTEIIGDQEWFAENLKTTRYNDGAAIPHVTDDRQWSNLSTGAYCWHDNDRNNGKIYGALYNWYAVNTGRICPDGWRVPTDEDWTTLVNYLGGEGIAGGILKATGALEAGDGLWDDPNYGATNETGFSALPGGLCWSLGSFGNIGNYGYWWSATEYSAAHAWYRSMYSISVNVDSINKA